MSPELMQMAGRAWRSAHRLVGSPRELNEAQEAARREPEPLEQSPENNR